MTAVPDAAAPNPAEGRLTAAVGVGAARPSSGLGDAPPQRTPAAGPRAGEYARWIRAYDSLGNADRDRIRRHMAEMPWRPRVDVVLISSSPASAEPAAWERTLASVAAQLYPDWSFVLLPPLRRAFQEARLSAPPPVMAATVTGDYVVFLEIGDAIAEHSLYAMIAELLRHPEAELIYSDEDEIDPQSGARTSPHFKAIWDPDLFLSTGYACRLAMIPSRALVEWADPTPMGAFDLLLRHTMRPDLEILHVPRILYHRAAEAGASFEAEAFDPVVAAALEMSGAAGAAVQRQADGSRRLVWPIPAQPPLVSLIVPTRDKLELLRECIDGFLYRTDYQNFEIIVVDNGSSDRETLDYLMQIRSNPRISVLGYDGEFNYSSINNFAAKQAQGSIIGLMNNDLKVMQVGWLREMVSHAARPDIGAVGARLLFADDTIQHAGIVLGMSERRLDGVAAHVGRTHAARSRGYDGWLRSTRELSAVTAACMLVPKADWELVGGLDDAFAVAFNDVDLCLRLRALGRRILWTPYAGLWHLESQSRGREDTPAKQQRMRLERELMWERWPGALREDPFFSPNLSLANLDWRPAFPPRLPSIADRYDGAPPDRSRDYIDSEVNAFMTSSPRTES